MKASILLVSAAFLVASAASAAPLPSQQELKTRITAEIFKSLESVDVECSGRPKVWVFDGKTASGHVDCRDGITRFKAGIELANMNQGPGDCAERSKTKLGNVFTFIKVCDMHDADDLLVTLDLEPIKERDIRK